MNIYIWTIFASSGFSFEINGLYIINFIALFAGIIYFSRKPLKFFIHHRGEKLRKEFEKREEFLINAEEKLKIYNEKIAKIENEIIKIKKDFRIQGETQRDKIIEEAQLIAKRMREEFEFGFNQLVKIKKNEIKIVIVEKAIKLAEEDLKKERNNLIHKKIFKEYIENLPA